MDGETSREEILGLRLPNGEEIFPPQQWHGRDVETPEDREHIYRAIKLSAINLGFTEEEICSRYTWVPKMRITAVVYEEESGEPLPLPLTGYIDPAAMPPPPVPQSDLESPTPAE
jgi:hypothetical protein